MTAVAEAPARQARDDVRRIVAGARPEIRGLVLDAADQGWTVHGTGSGHIRLTIGTGEPVFAPFTPSDWRSVHNVESRLRRQGFRPKEQRQRRERIREATQRQETPDPSLEEEAFGLLDENERLQWRVRQLEAGLLEAVEQLHDQDEEGLHAWDAAFCQRGCSRHLKLLRGGHAADALVS